MSTLVRRRVSGGTPNETNDAFFKQQQSTHLNDPQAASGGYRLGKYHDKPPMRSRSTNAPPTVMIALFVVACVGTWFAAQHWQFFASAPKKNWVLSKFPELETSLENSGKLFNDVFIVFVSISNGESKRVEQGRSSVSTVDAFGKAMDLHGTKQSTAKNHQHWIKVDVVDQVEAIPNFDVAKKLDEQVHSRGWFHGLALDWESGWAFLPEEVWVQNMIDAQTSKFRWDNVVAGALEKQQAGTAIDWSFFSKTRDIETSSLKHEIYLFHTSSFFLDTASSSGKSPLASQVLHLHHGHRLFDKIDITPDRLMKAANLAADYLKRSIATEDKDKVKKGRMVYQYNPRNDHESDNYSVPTQAGALYAMSSVLHDNKDAELHHRIRLGFDFLIEQHLRECHVMQDEDHPLVTKCVVEIVREEPHGSESRVAKLGANALTLLALSEFVFASRELQILDKGELDRYVGVARGVAEYIQATQHDDGSFIQKIQLWPTMEQDEEFYVRFYQGEAAFAMSRFYYVSGVLGKEQDNEWLEVAESAARYIVETQQEIPDHDFFDDPWLMNGLAELHRCGRKLGPRLIDFAIRTARVVAANQYTEDSETEYQLDHLDWLGIPDVKSTSAVSAATKSHGLCAVYELAVAYRYHKLEAAWIRDAVVNSVRYQLKAQYGPELAMYMKDQSRILGGLRKAVDSLYMRNDYTQHSLSSFLCLAKLLQNQ